MFSSPATPQRKQRGAGSLFSFGGEHPSTTPAGPPPPSSAPSFTPAGEPSPSFLQSSIGVMTGATKPKAPNFGRPSLSSSSKPRSRGPLASSIRGTGARQPSGLSKHSYSVLDDLSDDDEDDEIAPPARSGTYGLDFDDSDEDETEMDDSNAHAEEEEEEEEDIEDEQQEDEYEDDEEESEDDQMAEEDADYDIEEELLQEIAAEASGDPYGVDNMDITMPAATERMQREADDIFRASAMRSISGPRREFNFASVAKDLYNQLDYARITEPADVIIPTEDLVSRLFDEGVGTEDDEERLDDSLATAAEQLVESVWEPYSASLPKGNQEHEAKVGPGPNEPDFEKATWIAAMVFRIHHTAPLRDQFGGSQIVPLPLVLFKWQDDYHDPSRDQIESIKSHRPCPAAHSLFWQGVYMSLIRGNVQAAASLLRRAEWEGVKKGTRAERAYTGQVLSNINRVVEDVCTLMDLCPGMKDENWDIRSSDWTLFRIKAKAAKETLINFAEGKDRPHRAANRFNDSDLASPQNTLAGLARKAESRLPWDIYEALQSLYSILIGEAEAITAAAQDWCEATIGLFGWWDDGHSNRKLGTSLSRSQSFAAQPAGDDDWLDRLALSFRAAMDSDFHFNTLDPVEVCIACAFESNVEGIIGFLRSWSLPIASAVAEIASLGRWLPAPEADLIDIDNFSQEDLAVFGFNQSAGGSDKDGIKDAALIRYARGLNDIKQLTGRITKKSGNTTTATREGWELAVQVVGRMDDAGRSEELVNELLQSILDKLDPDSQATVNKMWTLLNDLGMINFAEDTAERYGDILREDTYRFGDMLWYYALAHRPGKVRDVLNGLMSISLAESTTYPPENELDDRLRLILKERTSTLEQFALQDLEAAELLGKMLSGYATLRKFYELRDGNGSNPRSLARRQQAATALSFVIASADDNIRGGLYDDTRDAVVSEDFILALLGEASVFVNQTPTILSQTQLDTLLKAVEDIQTVGSRVYDAADAFFQIVMSSGHGKGSTPADLMKKSTTSLGGSFVMTGSSMMASQLHKSIRESGVLKGPIKRTWDWRTTVLAGSSSGDVLKKIRLGLTRDIANIWLDQADSIIV
ncbi:putative Nuclear pore complex protein Nup85 [Seiridium unicorne]|uniref:Nuclear pore complex protein Nup85 n=1 Tax=Seiridium unicorne TaxID=138068 RepID=A0ABR2VGU7_9PEZI